MLDAETIKEITRLAPEQVGKVVHLHDGRQLVMVPEGFSVQDVHAVDKVIPSYIDQRVKFDDAASLIAYVNDFKTPKTRLFVSVSGTSISAEFDYHEAEDARPQRRAHIASWTMPFSEEWRRWVGIDGQSVGQTAFAEFLEENLDDIVDPVGASILEVATSLQSRKKVDFESGVRLSDGTVQITYREEAEGKGQVAVPSEITLGIPVFFGGDRYKIRCFFRYRINDGKLTFKVVMNRRLFIVQDAVQSAAAVVAEKTGLAALFGSPA